MRPWEIAGGNSVSAEALRFHLARNGPRIGFAGAKLRLWSFVKPYRGQRNLLGLAFWVFSSFGPGVGSAPMNGTSGLEMSPGFLSTRKYAPAAPAVARTTITAATIATLRTGTAQG